MKVCCFCKSEILDYGNSPAPIKTGAVCCNECNEKIVVAARVAFDAPVRKIQFTEADGNWYEAFKIFFNKTIKMKTLEDIAEYVSSIKEYIKKKGIKADKIKIG